MGIQASNGEAQMFSSTIFGLADMKLNVRYALVVEW
jgi:hypothetical protein